MDVYQIDPLRDGRWSSLLERHPAATIFQTPGWLEALRRTYGYDPVALTTAGWQQDLSNGLVFCRIRSWLTGRRAVSLPFSDHCDPLVSSPEDMEPLLRGAKRAMETENWRYFELRPATPVLEMSAERGGFKKFWLHKLDLKNSVGTIVDGFHKDCIRRKIIRAEREALSYEEGRSRRLLEMFYRLLVLTRRRHGLPPQPLEWFQNLTDCLGEALSIRTACKGERPVAAIVTLRYKSVLVYKYGCSDPRYNHLGGVQFLFWRAIQDAKRDGLAEFDFGRSDVDTPGLLAFKDRWGSARTTLHYWRFPASAAGGRPVWRAPSFQKVLAHLPSSLLATAGKLLYRHVG